MSQARRTQEILNDAAHYLLDSSKQHHRLALCVACIRPIHPDKAPPHLRKQSTARCQQLLASKGLVAEILRGWQEIRFNFAQPSCHCSMCLAFHRNLRQCRFCFGSDTKHGHTVPKGSKVAVCGLGRTSSDFFRHHAKLRPLYLAKIAHGASEVVARREVLGDEEKMAKLAKQEAKLRKCKAKFEKEQEQLEFDRFLAAETQRALESARKKFKAAHPNVHVPDQIGPSGSLGSTASPAAINVAAAFAPPPPSTISGVPAGNGVLHLPPPPSNPVPIADTVPVPPPFPPSIPATTARKCRWPLTPRASPGGHGRCEEQCADRGALCCLL